MSAEQIESYFPNLRQTGYAITSQANADYNCFINSIALFLFVCAASLARAQTSHTHPKPTPTPTEQHQHEHAKTGADMMTTVTGGPFRSMYAMGSGTGLQPASSPMTAWHWMPGEWMVMAHGQLIAGFNQQGGPRGVGKAEAANWLMLMGERNLGRGRLMLRGMLTAEPLTTPHGGFPLLFQTGETYRKRPIIDAQHPHDLFMELAASYTIPLGERASLQFYGGPVAEPALGPVAFMHRQSAQENPSAPLGHHWQDSTHITHGVVTTALTAGKFKFEASAFHGREPDEDRVRLDMGKLDSHSFRVWYAPAADWAMQVSWGRLKNPETIHPGDLKRWTASLSHNRKLARGSWASTLVWGRNNEYDPFFNERYISNAYLFESTLNFKERNHVYTRLELLDKQGLFAPNIFRRPGLPTGPTLPRADSLAASLKVALHPDPNEIDPFLFSLWRRVGAFTFGGVRDFYSNEQLSVGIGADATFYHKTGFVSAVYGARPVSYHIFLRFRTKGWMR
jgi:hypothetical protein